MPGTRFSAPVLISMLLATACTPPPPSSVPIAAPAVDAAQPVLRSYLAHLEQGRYGEAAELYGGSWEVLQDWNEDIPPEDHETLLQRACELNGLHCLKARDIRWVPGDDAPSRELYFDVEFENDDGSLFVRGPCCGANATVQPPESVFRFTVVEHAADRLVVMELPPYVP